MARTALTGAVVALLAALLAVTGTALGITTIWPVLLAVAVGLAAGHVTLGRVAAYVIGIAISWVMAAMTAGVLPQMAISDAIVVIVAVLVLTLIAVFSADRVPLWAGLAGYAAFAALYEPIYDANPTLFLEESPVALVTVLLAGALGVAIAAVAELLTSAVGDEPVRTEEVIEGGVL
jgi:hypothetical protein